RPRLAYVFSACSKAVVLSFCGRSVQEHGVIAVATVSLNRIFDMNVLLVNPPIYDFTAFDFWLRPYGLLRVGGKLRSCRLTTFDYLVSRDSDECGRGRFERELITKPAPLRDIPRRFYRFGRPREEFLRLLSTQTFDVVLVQTVMTYWYLGVSEVIEDVRRF